MPSIEPMLMTRAGSSAVPAAASAGTQGAGQQERRLRVEGQHLVPRVGGVLGERRAPRGARVVHEDVQSWARASAISAASRSHSSSRERSAGRLTQVPDLRELGGDLVADVGLAGRDVDLGPGLDVAPGDHQPDAPAPARDQGRLAGDVEESGHRRILRSRSRAGHGAAARFPLKSRPPVPIRRSGAGLFGEEALASVWPQLRSNAAARLAARCACSSARSNPTSWRPGSRRWCSSSAGCWRSWSISSCPACTPRRRSGGSRASRRCSVCRRSCCRGSATVARAQLAVPFFAFVLFAWGGVMPGGDARAVSRDAAAAVRLRRLHAAARARRAALAPLAVVALRGRRPVPLRRAPSPRRSCSRCRCSCSSARRSRFAQSRRTKAEAPRRAAARGRAHPRPGRRRAPSARSSSRRSRRSCSGPTRSPCCSPTAPGRAASRTVPSSGIPRSPTRHRCSSTRSATAAVRRARAAVRLRSRPGCARSRPPRLRAGGRDGAAPRHRTRRRSAWSSRCGRRRAGVCPPSARQAAELLSEEAGRMFRRLRDVGRAHARRRDRSAHPARQPAHVRPRRSRRCSPATRSCSSTSTTSSR